MSVFGSVIESLVGMPVSLEEFGRSGERLLKVRGKDLIRHVHAVRPTLESLRSEGVEAIVLLFRPEETIEFLVAALAAFSAGLKVAPFYPNWSEATQREYFEAYGFRAVAHARGFRSRAESWAEALSARTIAVDVTPTEGDEDAAPVPPLRIDCPPGATCAWIFTSGTSGTLAKLTEITFGNMDSVAENVRELDFLHEGMTVHNPLSVSHIFAFAAMLGFLAIRPSRVLLSDVQYLARLPESKTGKVDGMILVPIVIHRMRSAFYERLTQSLEGSKVPPELRKLTRVPLAIRRVLKKVALRAEQAVIDLETTGRAGVAGRTALAVVRRLFGGMFRSRLGSPRFIVVGGAKPSVPAMAFIEAMGIRCLQGWGMTETTGPLAVCHVGDRYRGALGTCGTLFKGTRVFVEDGELVVEGAQVAWGYRDPDGTRHPFHGRKRTGDQAEFDSEGRLKIIGKASDRITTLNGLNYSPVPFEEQIHAMDLERANLIEQVVIIGEGQASLGAVFFVREGAREQVDAERYVAELVRTFNESRPVDERVGTWALDPMPLGESSFLGPTGKLQRHRVQTDYARIFDRV